MDKPRRGRKPPVPLAPEAARERALRALGRREHSARELTRKLTHDGLDKGNAAEVVGELSESGWQSDARYAGLLTRSRISQGYGPLRIRAELSARGVDEALIRATLEEEAPDWLDIVGRVHDRRYSKPPTTPKERASRYRYLASRGFTSSQVAAVLGSVVGSDEEIVEDDAADDAADLD
ncbi:regulatory protein RecX [Nevskia sp.]|uniref:regulatory protein RecX n=1 Tax=Nevskia sp. TaxID=1929292 RepID=UPI0025EBBB66|nr:regulatory protein RecX [Nevskia sp.]